MTRTPIPSPRRRRGGFTLIELLVAAAISVIIMAVLATAFQLGIDTMRQMRSAADMANQLRAAQGVIQRDLQGDCFVAEDGKPNNGLKVSNQRFDLNGGAVILNPAPAGGFMFISSGVTLGEGTDSSAIASTIANPGLGTAPHLLQFTSVLKNNSEQNVFTAISPPGNAGKTFTSRAAEVGYFLSPMTPPGATSGLGPGASAVPLFNLCRRQRLVAFNTDDTSTLAVAALADSNASDVISGTMSGPSTIVVNTMQTLTNAGNRAALVSFPPGNARFGEDVLLSNVISFEVKVNWVPQPGGKILSPRPFNLSSLGVGAADTPSTSSGFPYDTLDVLAPPFKGVFDTSALPPIRVLALQIQVRVFDPKLNNARQITIVQNL